MSFRFPMISSNKQSELQIDTCNSFVHNNYIIDTSNIYVGEEFQYILIYIVFNSIST